MLGLGLRLNRGVLGSYLNSILKYSVGDWGINSSTIRLRRNDDDFEKEFLSVAGVLDVASITDFNSWNMLDGGAYRDYLYDVPLGVDATLNGVSDGWSFIDNAVTVTMPSIEENAQKITITNANSSSSSPTITESVASFNAGDEVSFKFKFKTDNMNLRYVVRTLPSSTNLNTVTNLVSEGDYTEVLFSGIVTAGDTSIDIIFAIRANNIGDTGSIWVKESVLVKNSFIENIGKLTVDDNLDGVANNWSSFEPGNFVFSIDNGQKFDINNSNTTDSGYIFYDVPASEGDIVEIEIDSKYSDLENGVIDLGWRDIANANFLGTRKDVNVTTAEYSTYTITQDPAPAGTGYIRILLYATPNLTDTFSVWFKDVTLKQTNNSTDDTKVFDKSSNGNHAVQTVAPYQPNLIDEGVINVMSDGSYTMKAQDATKELIVASDSSLDFITDFTVMVKLQVPIGTTSGSILGKFITAESKGYDLILNPNPQMVIRGTSSIDTGNTSETIADDTVHIITFVCTNTDIKYYLDGVLISTHSGTWTPTISTNDFVIFNREAGLNTGGAIIDISNVLLLNKALTQTEIAYLTSKV